MTGGSFQITTQVNVSGVKAYLNGANTITLNTSASCTEQLSFGTTTSGVSVEVNQIRGLGVGASETLNLYDGSLLDIYGDPAVFRTVRGFGLWITSGGDTSGLKVEGGDSNPTTLFWTGTTPGKTVYPSSAPELGGSLVGVSITSSAYSLKVTNNGAVAVNYQLIVAGSAGVSGSPIGLLLGLLYP